MSSNFDSTQVAPAQAAPAQVAPAPAPGSTAAQGGLKTTAYIDRTEYGIPRITLTKGEFLHVRPHGLYTTSVFDNVGMGVKKSIQITNKEVAKLVAYRAAHGQTWNYRPENRKDGGVWMSCTDERCEDYEYQINNRIIKGLEEAIELAEKARQEREEGLQTRGRRA